ncbi:MAG: radical SAM protein [Candidatus Gracilibacteria bacterium]
MYNDFLYKSNYLLLKLLEEPGGYSFFPSSFFWKNNINNEKIKDIFIDFFISDNVNIDGEYNKVNLYIHIPFCYKICSYCNCFKMMLKNEAQIDKYLDFLEKEAILLIGLNNHIKIKINTIFIGGGTPNLLSLDQFNKLFIIIDKYFDKSSLDQFMVDCHPNFLNKNKIDLFYKNGINRLTIAIQTLDKKVLIKNNRDYYNLEDLKSNIDLLKKYGIKINIDILIGLNGQIFDSIKKDIDFFIKLGVDNISDHYLMISNNIKYKFDADYQKLFNSVKKYLLGIKFKNNSENLQENYFVSKKSSTISLGSNAVNNLFSGIIYGKPKLSEYYKALNDGIIPFEKGLLVSLKIEKIKYIYLNILKGIDIDRYYLIFSSNIFKDFQSEFNFLTKLNIISLNGNIISSNKNDYETLLHFNIFLLKFIKSSKVDFDIKNLNLFFNQNGDLLDK